MSLGWFCTKLRSLRCLIDKDNHDGHFREEASHHLGMFLCLTSEGLFWICGDGCDEGMGHFWCFVNH